MLLNTSLLKSPQSWFHLFVMLLVIAFGAAMIARSFGANPATAKGQNPATTLRANVEDRT